MVDSHVLRCAIASRRSWLGRSSALDDYPIVSVPEVVQSDAAGVSRSAEVFGSYSVTARIVAALAGAASALSRSWRLKRHSACCRRHALPDGRGADVGCCRNLRAFLKRV